MTGQPFTSRMKLQILEAFGAEVLVGDEWQPLKGFVFAAELKTSRQKFVAIRHDGCRVRCAGCGEVKRLHDIQFDHTKAKRFGGLNVAENGQPLCGALTCHQGKSNEENESAGKSRRCKAKQTVRRGLKADVEADTRFKRSWGSREIPSRPFPERRSEQ